MARREGGWLERIGAQRRHYTSRLQLKFEPALAISREEPQPNEIAERRQARY
jgi:hypothetical protein